jgi:class 3 adenylate cyclase
LVRLEIKGRDMYTVEQNASSPGTAIRRLVGREERPVDPQDESFMAFADEVMKQAGHPLVKRNPWLPPFDILFETRDEVVQFCKEHGARPIVRQEESGRAVLGHGRSAATPRGKGWIFSLLTAISPLPGSHDVEERDGIVGEESSLWISGEIDRDLAGELDDEASDVRRLSTWPIRRAFVYTDISDFSRYEPGQQVLMAGGLARIARHHGFWDVDPLAQRALADLETMLCIGDGYIFIFKDSTHATYFAAHLAALIELLAAKTLLPVEIHFRIGVHVGPVYCFWDLGRKDWNYIGEGINGGQRVMSVIGRETDDVVFISSRVRQDLLASSDHEGPARLILSNAQNRGRRHDKQGNPWRVYEVNHANLISDSLRSLKGIAPELN